MIEIGKYNTLTVQRTAPAGLYLGHDAENVVLLPSKYVPKITGIGREIDVFVYKDGEGRLIATTQRPLMTLHEIARLKAVSVNETGAFLDWGLDKDLFVPFREQNQKMEYGKYYLIYLYLDEQTDRLVGSARIHRFLSNENIELEKGDEVSLIIQSQSDLGYNVIVNQKHSGLIYENEIYANIRPGDIHKGYIKNIRPDKNIDVTLQKPGYDHVEPNAALILEKLQANNGFLELTDKSDPETIKSQLQMSKKTFKKAIGLLYKERRIQLETSGIKLLETPTEKTPAAE